MTNSFFEEKLCLIQGDVFSPLVHIENHTDAEILKAFFSSYDLGITKELTASGDMWTMRIPGEITKNFSIGQASYDITVEFADGSRYTARYEGELVVMEKKNEVICGE